MRKRHTSSMNDLERMILRNIDRLGWHCTSVFDQPEGGTLNPPFTYSVGLYETYRQPEFIVLGLTAEVAFSIIGVCAGKFADGKTINLDLPAHDLIKNYSCAFVDVPRKKYKDYVLSAMWYYGNRGFPVHQIVWPDENGLFPWHPETTARFRQSQPVLGCADDHAPVSRE